MSAFNIPRTSSPLRMVSNPPHVRLNSGNDNILNDPESLRPESALSMTGSRQRPRPSNISIYQQPRRMGESSEMLLAPRKIKSPRRFHDEESPMQSPISANPSRRTSWSTDSGGGPFMSPFEDQSRAPSRAGSEDDYVNTQTVSEKYNILPSAGLLIFPEDIEKDDYLHNPDPNDKDRNECDVLSTRGVINVGGLALITLGILMLFVGYPVLSVVPHFRAHSNTFRLLHV